MCGLGFVADLRGGPSHDIVVKGLEILRRLRHRGASGSDPASGDGAGILLQVPHAFYERVTGRLGLEIPNAGDYGVAFAFLSRDPARRVAQVRILEESVRYHNQKVIGWREVPVEARVLGPLAEKSRPVMRQLFIGRVCEKAAFERTLFMIRKRAGRLAAEDSERARAPRDFYIASCSASTVVYKGLMLPERLADFYLDLAQDELKSRISLVHSRFSTNTFPSWERAHPYRRIAHNGEINTLRGNASWMAAREPMLRSDAFGEHIGDFKPIIRPDGSDSASLDNVVDFLIASGRSLPHVMMMLVPEAWSSQKDMAPANRAFYEYHANLVEPWDGPAALLFTDGRLVGATLDRNGLRPVKYVVTRAGRVVVASELGVLDVEPDDVLEKGRLMPGKMLVVDTAKGSILNDATIKAEIAGKKPYAEWVEKNRLELSSFTHVSQIHTIPKDERERLMRAFGYSREDVRLILRPMAEGGEEPTGSMGNDAPLAVLSERPQLLFRYFKQQFAQVTNPPIDPIREDLVMSLMSCVGGEGNLLEETPRQARMLELAHPVLTNDAMARIKDTGLAEFRSAVLAAHFSPHGSPGESLALALDELCLSAIRAVDEGASILVVSDRGVDADRAPIPSLLALSAVHNALLRAGKRMGCGLVVESAEPREVADVALLFGYGAGAVSPYLALEAISQLGPDGTSGLGPAWSAPEACAKYTKAIEKGLLKVMSKMGISTLSSYQGAQIFEAIGLGQEVIERYFPGTISVLGGIGLDEIAEEALALHARGFGPHLAEELPIGGQYAWRKDGEKHLWSPESVAALQKAVRAQDEGAARSYEEYARLINDQRERPVTLRGLWEFHAALPPVPIDEVEPAANIVKRFATGAMSFGSISKEAHENLAVAMNRIGGKSNSGEGGEDEARFAKEPNGDWRRSAIKQVASARFGVTAHYLVNADELQIKIAQGAKPGEGGQLPGHKVDAVIARVRHATPGVTLISPPPHHDIYSIEDLAQLIHDLKTVNPHAKVSVKLVAETGVGTIAAGVVKARADAVHIAGHDGGTGASPLSSIQHAGVPWEVGLAETQQVLLLNGLRGRAAVQVDGQLKTGRDVAFAALLGADEFGFATAPLVASGCVMMRKCHLNTCPVGVATQDPELRKRFRGTPEHVIRFFFYVAEELRAIMARLGFRTLMDMIGRTDCIVVRDDVKQKKARMLDFGALLRPPRAGVGPLHRVEKPRAADGTSGAPAPAWSTREETPLEAQMLEDARLGLKYGEPCSLQVSVTNADRAFGARLAGEVARRFGGDGLPDGTITIEATGTAGQSFGAFATRGMLLVLEGDANDYVGKGLSGGVLAIRPPARARFRADQNVIVGNTVLYGATAGKAFFAGRAGERFCVRNSGATAVVEGCGDHGCEYMTGGVALILGGPGRNFAAGMSGGIAYVLDDCAFASRCNLAMVDLEALGDEDAASVQALIEEHVAHTRSRKGSEILKTWDKQKFIKVMPRDYKAAIGGTRVLKVVS
jgi:glutamate synthase (NADPH/NADH) large chain